MLINVKVQWLQLVIHVVGLERALLVKLPVILIVAYGHCQENKVGGM
jgi:hypothetical protein